jgi:hypothetical protein
MMVPAVLDRVVADLDRAGTARFAPAFALLHVAHVSLYRCAADESLRDALVAIEV